MPLVTAASAMIAEEGADELGRGIDAGEHLGKGNSNCMLAATADHIAATSKAA